MSEDNQENGASNGDVPEIELIIKEETNIIDVSVSEEDSMAPQQLDEPLLPVEQIYSRNDQYIIYELKSDNQPSYSYVVTNPKEPPPNCANRKEGSISDSIVSRVTQVIANPEPQYTISYEIPIANDQIHICKENSPKTKRALARKARSLAKTKRTLRRQRLAEAIVAVVNEEMTISQAAKTFEVTKSNLWKEVNKHTNHRKKIVDEDRNKKIVDRICAGESLSKIARSLNVAKSTVHQHKVRLAEAGKLPPNVTFKPPIDKMKQLAIKERIIRAFRGVRVNGMSLRLASTYFSVPRSTLWKHIQRFKAFQKKQGQSVQICNVPKKPTNDDFSENSLEETSEEEDSTEEEEDEADSEDATEAGENTSDVQSNTTDSGHQDDFDLLDTYCEQYEVGASEEGDFFISFDFETFEEYVKTETDFEN